MNSPTTHTECEQHRKAMEDLVKKMVRETEERMQKEIVEMKSTITMMDGKLDNIPWQLVVVCLVIIGAIVGVTVFV